MSESNPYLVDRRYILKGKLGKGGMGVVYLAEDRLGKNQVALKQVLKNPVDLLFATKGTYGSNDLSLAQEFKILASLRHPNIVSVLDYGFDRNNQPFFTMEYLPSGENFIEAIEGKSTVEIVEYLIQILESLVYLHRRNLLHRDLKPSNIIVNEGKIKVLDFGISQVVLETQNLTGDVTGSFVYMAPELLQNKQVTRSSDLYSFGVIAYEAFLGDLPFDNTNIGVFIAEKLSKEIDFTNANIDEKIIVILKKLLMRDSSKRYKTATAVIKDLSETVGLPAPIESSEIRESFLQAAKFVGRDKEIEMLSIALEKTINGKGETWLVGGESGVGKTRLLDEIRTLSMVKGALVIHGQAINEGGSPYHLWKNIFTHLVIYGDLSDEEQSILKPYVTKIEDFLGKSVPDPTPLAPLEEQIRLIDTIHSIIEKIPQLLVLILEDLHWADSGSIVMLERLTNKLDGQSVMIIANYRDDERPQLPNDIPGSKFLSLERLSENAITELSISMLGQSGSEAEIIDFLDRETEGNPFFLVETVRALAEQAGDLTSVGKMDLPDKIFSGGVHEIMQRRIGKIKNEMMPLLELAAISGRQIDLSIIKNLSKEINVEDWIRDCSDSAVIDMIGGQWRFSHDKLREYVIDEMDNSFTKKLNVEVAQSIEDVHNDDPHYYAALASHWLVGEDDDKAIHYSKLAGKQAMANNAMGEAEKYFIICIKLLEKQPETIQREEKNLEIKTLLGSVYFGLKGWGAEEVKTLFENVVTISKKLNKETISDVVLIGLWGYYFVKTKFEKSETYVRKALVQSKYLDDPTIIEIMCNNSLAANYSMMGWYEQGLMSANKVLEIYDHDTHHVPLVFINTIDIAAGPSHGWAIWNSLLLGYPEESKRFAEKGDKMVNINSHPHTTAYFRSYILQAGTFKREYEFVASFGQELCKFSKDNHNFPDWYYVGLFHTGFAKAMLGKEEGLEMMKEAIDYEREGIFMNTIRDTSLYAQALAKYDRVEEAVEFSEESIQLLEETRTFQYGAEIYRINGDVLLKIGKSHEEVERAYEKSIDTATGQNAKWWELRSSVSLARLWQSQGKIEEARDLLKPVYDWFAEGFDLVDLIEAKSLLEELSK